MTDDQAGARNGQDDTAGDDRVEVIEVGTRDGLQIERYLLHESGYRTGVDLYQAIAVAKKMEQTLGRQLSGQVMRAGPRLTLHEADAVGTAAG